VKLQLTSAGIALVSASAICRLNATEALVFFGSCGLLIKLARPALPCCCSAHNCIVDD
jgi:hypothetical protein